MTKTLQLTFGKPEWAKEFLDDLSENKPCNEYGDVWDEIYGPIDAGFVPDNPETAEEGMKREMLNAIRGVVGEREYGSVWFRTTQVCCDPGRGDGATLAEAIRNIPNPEKQKQQRIAELEMKELAKLKEGK